MQQQQRAVSSESFMQWFKVYFRELNKADFEFLWQLNICGKIEVLPFHYEMYAY